MGIELSEARFFDLWTLVAKRLVYLCAKLVSFKGLGFFAACYFLQNGVISDYIWCGMVLGIITNRVIQAKQKGEACNEEEAVYKNHAEALCTTGAAYRAACSARVATASGTSGTSERAKQSAAYAERAACAEQASANGKRKLTALATGNGAVQGD